MTTQAPIAALGTVITWNRTTPIPEGWLAMGNLGPAEDHPELVIHLATHYGRDEEGVAFLPDLDYAHLPQSMRFIIKATPL